MSVWSFCPTQILTKLSEIKITNKGNGYDLIKYKSLWINWIKHFKGCEYKKEWAICNGIHDAIVNQIAYRSTSIDVFYVFDTDYQFYPVILKPYNHRVISPSDIGTMRPNSYVIISQPNHEGNITPWFNNLKYYCQKNNIKIFLDCAFYGTTFDTLDTFDPVFDAVAFSLSKNFLLAGWRSGIVFGDDLAKTLTIPISIKYDYNYFNIAAVECAKVVLPNFKPTYITQYAKKHQLEYCLENNLTPADIWMLAFDKNQQKVCITDFLKEKIQSDLDYL